MALGPHCFIGREQVLATWQRLHFVEAYADQAAMETAERNLRWLVNHLLPGIVEKLNAYHGTSYSIDFWRIIVLPWLTELAQKAWSSFARMRHVRELDGHRPLTVGVLQDEPKWRFRDTTDFFNTMLNDFRFNWWIESQMVAALGPVNWRLQPSGPIFHPGKRGASEPPRDHAPGRIRTMLRHLKYRIGYSDILGTRIVGLLLAVYANMLPKTPSRMHFEADPNFRPESFFPRSFLAVLDRLMDATMPLSFLDGFNELAKKAGRLPYVPGRLRLGTLSNWNEQEKVIAAFAKEAGEKRVGVQHGGEYGLVNYNLLSNLLEGSSCIFASWGWAYDEPKGGHILPLPSPALTKIANRHCRRDDSLIFVAGGIRLLLGRIHWCNLNNGVLRYCYDPITFLKYLDPEVRESVVFRPYTRTANDIDIGAEVHRHFPSIQMLETGFHDALMKCRMVVLCSFGTTMNHALAANVPTVIYLPPDLMTPRAEAEPYFTPLRRCGVIHDSAEAAAAHVNRIWDDVEGWWSGDEVQEARRIWVYQFARTDRFWWWHWMKALSRLRDVG